MNVGCFSAVEQDVGRGVWNWVGYSGISATALCRKCSTGGVKCFCFEEENICTIHHALKFQLIFLYTEIRRDIAISYIPLSLPLIYLLPPPSLQSWAHMVQQTEQLSKIMKCHAEELNSGPLHRLTMMIKDKQQVKKSYQSIHTQIEFEMNKVLYALTVHTFTVSSYTILPVH